LLSWENIVVRTADINNENIIKSMPLLTNDIFPDQIVLIISRPAISTVKKSTTIDIPFSVKSHGKGRIDIGSIAIKTYNKIF
jgi:hypothetical protein